MSSTGDVAAATPALLHRRQVAMGDDQRLADALGHGRRVLCFAAGEQCDELLAVHAGNQIDLAGLAASQHDCQGPSTRSPTSCPHSSLIRLK